MQTDISKKFEEKATKLGFSIVQLSVKFLLLNIDIFTQK